MDLSVLTDLCDDYTDDFVVDPSEVDKRLSSIKIHKAPGPDVIPNWLLCDFSSLLCQPLAAIFNSSIREGFVPPIWKSAEVVPVPTRFNPKRSPSNLSSADRCQGSRRHSQRLAYAVIRTVS